MKLRIAGTNPAALTDGPGKRFSIYVQGCHIHCPGCQVPHLHDPHGGDEVDVRDLAQDALASGLPVSILGGEPTEQPEALAALLVELKRADRPPHVVVYSGRTFEQLYAQVVRAWPTRRDAALLLVLFHADVLVDGPFEAAADHDRLQYRGSANQRVVDLRATMRLSRRALQAHGPRLLGWDTPVVLVTEAGDLVAAEGLAGAFAALGASAPARRCGEVPR